jgi:hypothetical protein
MKAGTAHRLALSTAKAPPRRLAGWAWGSGSGLRGWGSRSDGEKIRHRVAAARSPAASLGAGG